MNWTADARRNTAPAAAHLIVVIEDQAHIAFALKMAATSPGLNISYLLVSCFLDLNYVRTIDHLHSMIVYVK